MNCRSGCPSKDHHSYAECLQAANVRINAIINSPHQAHYEATKTDLAAYRAARADGIQPESTHKEKIDAAIKMTKALGRPYNAEKDPPTNLIVNKQALSFAKETAK